MVGRGRTTWNRTRCIYFHYSNWDYPKARFVSSPKPEKLSVRSDTQTDNTACCCTQSIRFQLRVYERVHLFSFVVRVWIIGSEQKSFRIFALIPNLHEIASLIEACFSIWEYAKQSIFSVLHWDQFYINKLIGPRMDIIFIVRCQISSRNMSKRKVNNILIICSSEYW